jgi:hypothetical protein
VFIHDAYFSADALVVRAAIVAVVCIAAVTVILVLRWRKQ